MEKYVCSNKKAAVEGGELQYISTRDFRVADFGGRRPQRVSTEVLVQVHVEYNSYIQSMCRYIQVLYKYIGMLRIPMMRVARTHTSQVGKYYSYVYGYVHVLIYIVCGTVRDMYTCKL